MAGTCIVCVMIHVCFLHVFIIIAAGLWDIIIRSAKQGQDMRVHVMSARRASSKLEVGGARI